jgi:hypothetical protein
MIVDGLGLLSGCIVDAIRNGTDEERRVKPSVDLGLGRRSDDRLRSYLGQPATVAVDWRKPGVVTPL